MSGDWKLTGKGKEGMFPSFRGIIQRGLSKDTSTMSPASGSKTAHQTSVVDFWQMPWDCNSERIPNVKIPD